MHWNWQQPDWPKFTYDKTRLETLEADFLLQTGILIGVLKHVAVAEHERLTVELLSDEALKTSEIEGEYLNRDSVQASILKQFGLAAGEHGKPVPDAEQGIADMMVDLYRCYAEPLSHDRLFTWHGMLMRGRDDLNVLGGYRTHPEPMQVVSGYIHKPKIHFEAPPSEHILEEMDRFCDWFNQSAPTGREPLSALIRAGMAHLYFVSIHPFEDGNGRIARALAEKALAQCLGQPSLILLAGCIQENRRPYYDALEKANKQNEITGWLHYFGETILTAQKATRQRVEFIIEKAKLYERTAGKLNARQEKALARVFAEGPKGFTGGLSADNYIRITKTSRATATRDLNDLVERGVFRKTGERKHTRYSLILRCLHNDA